MARLADAVLSGNDFGRVRAAWAAACELSIDERHRHASSAPLLVAAARGGLADMVACLLDLEATASFAACDCVDEAIAAAVTAGHLRCTTTLVRFGTPATRDRALYVAAMHADRDMVGEMLAAAPDTNVLEAVRIAATFDHVDVLDALLSHPRSSDEQVPLVDAALWRACSALSVATVAFLVERHGAEASPEHFVAAITGGSRRLKRTQVEVLACRIAEILIARAPLCAQALKTHGPMLLQRAQAMQHRRLFRLLLGHGARADGDEALLAQAIDSCERDEPFFLHILHEIGVRVRDVEQLSPPAQLQVARWSADTLTTRQHRQRVRCALQALSYGRVVLQRSERGAFDVLTRWLDIELLSALADHVLEEREVRVILAAITNGAFYASKEEAVTDIVGWRAMPSTSFFQNPSRQV